MRSPRFAYLVAGCSATDIRQGPLDQSQFVAKSLHWRTHSSSIVEVHTVNHDAPEVAVDIVDSAASAHWPDESMKAQKTYASLSACRCRVGFDSCWRSFPMRTGSTESVKCLYV